MSLPKTGQTCSKPYKCAHYGSTPTKVSRDIGFVSSQVLLQIAHLSILGYDFPGADFRRLANEGAFQNARGYVEAPRHQKTHFVRLDAAHAIEQRGVDLAWMPLWRLLREAVPAASSICRCA